MPDSITRNPPLFKPISAGAYQLEARTYAQEATEMPLILKAIVAILAIVTLTMITVRS